MISKVKQFLSTGHQAKKLEENLLDFIAEEVATIEEPTAVISIALGAMLVKINKIHGLPKEEFLRLMEATWDNIVRDVH